MSVIDFEGFYLDYACIQTSWFSFKSNGHRFDLFWVDDHFIFVARDDLRMDVFYIFVVRMSSLVMMLLW